MHRGLVGIVGGLCGLATLAGGARAAADPSATYVQQFLDAYERAHSFSGRVATVTNVGGKSVAQRFQLALEKPNRTAMVLLSDSATPAAKGTKIVWLGGPTCQVSTHVFGFPLALGPRYDDPRLRGPGGYTMRDLSVATAVAVTRDPSTRFKLLREERYLGRPAHVLEVRSGRLLPGVDHEVLWLDSALHLPFQRDMVTGDGKIRYHVAVETYQIDQALAADTFVAK